MADVVPVTVVSRENRDEGQSHIQTYAEGWSKRKNPDLTVTKTDQEQTITTTETKKPSTSYRYETVRAVDVTTTSTTPEHIVTESALTPEATTQNQTAYHIGMTFDFVIRLRTPLSTTGALGPTGC